MILPCTTRPLLVAAMLALAGITAQAQPSETAATDWQEGEVPPPPAYNVQRLIDIEMPRAAAVRMGIDPDTIRLDHGTGVVRYVVVARGPSATNATYEGIRCATGEWRVYARQVQGGEWTSSGESGWQSMRGQTSVMVQHPYRLARDGLCLGTGLRQTTADIVRELRSGNASLYR